MATKLYRQIDCKSVGISCGFLVRCETEGECLRIGSAHAQQVHGMSISPEMEQKVKSAFQSVYVEV